MDNRIPYSRMTFNETKNELLHESADGKCSGKIKIIVDDDGNIKYRCSDCKKEWLSQEKLSPIDSE